MKNQFFKTILCISISTTISMIPLPLNASDKKNHPQNILVSVIGTIGTSLQGFMGEAFKNKTRTAASLLTLNVIYRHHNTIYHSAKDQIEKIAGNQTISKIFKGFAAAPFAYLAGTATDMMLTKTAKSNGINISSTISNFGVNYITQLIFNTFTDGTRIHRENNDEKKMEQEVEDFIKTNAKISYGTGKNTGKEPNFSDTETSSAYKLLLAGDEKSPRIIAICGRSGSGKTYGMNEVQDYADKDTCFISFSDTQSLVEWGIVGQDKFALPKLLKFIEETKTKSGAKKVIVTFDEADRAVQESEDTHALARNKAFINILDGLGKKGVSISVLGNFVGSKIYPALRNRFNGNHSLSGEIGTKTSMPLGPILQNSIDSMLKTQAEKLHISIQDEQAAARLSSLFSGFHLGKISKQITSILEEHNRRHLYFDTNEKCTQAIIFKHFLEVADTELKTNKEESENIKDDMKKGSLEKGLGEKMLSATDLEKRLIEKNIKKIKEHCPEIVENIKLTKELPTEHVYDLKALNEYFFKNDFNTLFEEEGKLNDAKLKKAHKAADFGWWYSLIGFNNPYEKYDENTLRFIREQSQIKELKKQQPAYQLFKSARHAKIYAQSVVSKTIKTTDTISSYLDPIHWISKASGVIGSITNFFTAKKMSDLEKIQKQLAPFVASDSINRFVAETIYAQKDQKITYRDLTNNIIGNYVLGNDMSKKISLTTDTVTGYQYILIAKKDITIPNQERPIDVLAEKIIENMIHKEVTSDQVKMCFIEENDGIYLDIENLGKALEKCPKKIQKKASLVKPLFDGFTWDITLKNEESLKENKKENQEIKEKKIIEKKIGNLTDDKKKKLDILNIDIKKETTIKQIPSYKKGGNKKNVWKKE